MEIQKTKKGLHNLQNRIENLIYWTGEHIWKLHVKNMEISYKMYEYYIKLNSKDNKCLIL